MLSLSRLLERQQDELPQILRIKRMKDRKYLLHNLLSKNSKTYLQCEIAGAFNHPTVQAQVSVGPHCLKAIMRIRRGRLKELLFWSKSIWRNCFNENNYTWFCYLNVDKNMKNGRTCLDSISRGKWERYYVESNSKDNIIPDHVGGVVSSEYTICIFLSFFRLISVCVEQRTLHQTSY